MSYGSFLMVAMMILLIVSPKPYQKWAKVQAYLLGALAKLITQQMPAMLTWPEKKAINDRLDVDLLLACFKQVVIEDWCDQS